MAAEQKTGRVEAINTPVSLLAGRAGPDGVGPADPPWSGLDHIQVVETLLAVANLKHLGRK